MPEDRAIETHDLSKKYGDRLAVDRLNLTVASKQVHGFLGPNGAGKSTTIKMMVGLLRPTSGSLSILGQGNCQGRDTRLLFIPPPCRGPASLRPRDRDPSRRYALLRDARGYI